MSTKSAESRDNSPDGSPEKRASKKRKVLSCYACRNRKMKCDRIYPACGRCQRTGRADQCTYDPRLLNDLPANNDGLAEGGFTSFPLPDNPFVGGTSSVGGSSDALNWKLRMQERRLETLERRLNRVSNGKNIPLDAPPSHLDDFDAQAHEPVVREEMVFRGRGFKTQFSGSTSPLSVISQFGELQAFTREALMSDSSIIRIRADFKTFRNQRKASKKEKERQTQGSDADILELVPEKSVMDAKVALYFHAFETSYRILHEPTFWNEYRAFWEQRQGGGVTSSFATILVLIVAFTKCLVVNEANVFIGDSSADRESASNLIEACDTWILRQSRKHLTLHFFQLQCLTLLAKRVNCVKLKQDWVNSGDLIRLAMASGMHRNPSLVLGGRLSEFEKEMRRRLWATMMELEFQSSIDCGLQSSLCGLHFDTQPPANIPDEAFLADSAQAPSSRPIEHFTSTSYLTVSLRSLPLRVHLMQLLNNPTTNLQYSDVLHYDAQLSTLISSLPSWDSPRATTVSALLDFQLRQFLLMLHRPYAKEASKNPHYSFSFTACVDAANGIINIYDDLNEKGILTLNHVRNDVLRTAVTLSQVVYHNSIFPQSNEQNLTAHPSANNPIGFADTADRNNAFAHPSPPGQSFKIAQLPHNNFLVTTLCTAAIALAERARALYEHKVMRLGTGYMEHWFIAASIGILPPAPSSLPITSIASLTNHDDVKSRVRKAVDRTTALCFRVLAMQKDPANSFASSLGSTVPGASPSDLRMPSANVDGLIGNTPRGTGVELEMPILLPGPMGLVSALQNGGDRVGAWDALDDMQVDMAGWSLPDFWVFDMGGDF